MVDDELTPIMFVLRVYSISGWLLKSICPVIESNELRDASNCVGNYTLDGLVWKLAQSLIHYNCG